MSNILKSDWINQATRLVSLTVSIICWLFLVTKLRLNGYIKSILLIMISFNIIFLIGLFFGGLLLKDQFECILHVNLIQIMGSGNYIMNSVISFLRFYMAKLATKTKIIKKSKAILIIIFGSIFSYCWVAILSNLAYHSGHKSIFSTVCHENDEKLPPNPITATLVPSGVILGILIGLYFNIQMYFMVKKTQLNSGQGTAVIPWKSNSNNLESDLQVPIRATMATSITTILVIISGIFHVFVYDEGDGMQAYYWISLMNGFVSPFLPISLMLFTVKHQTKVQASQPPKGLQFHQDIELEEIASS